MTTNLIKNADLFDADTPELHGGSEVFIEGDRIKEVSDTPITASAGAVIDLGGKALLPGLIDAHVHVYSVVVEYAERAGALVGHGSDLLGEMQRHQSREFLLKSEAMTARETLVSATKTNATILNRDGELGVVAPGALANLVAVDGDPLKDLGLLQDQGAYKPAIMKGGVFVKNELN